VSECFRMNEGGGKNRSRAEMKSESTSIERERL
jgi:hypothetical protein